MSTKPEESREAEREAMEWLDRTGPYAEFLAFTEASAVARATLKAMLAQPRLPEEPTGAALIEMYEAMYASGPNRCRAIYRALYAHLSAKPKPTPTWTVTWRSKYSRPGDAYAHPSMDFDDATSRALELAEQGHVVTIRCDAP